MSTFAEYKARILSYVEGKDPLQVQRKTPEVLADLVVSVPEKKLYERPSPDKWSVAELLAHFADAEIVGTWRYRQMIEHDGCPLWESRAGGGGGISKRGGKVCGWTFPGRVFSTAVA